MPLSKPILDFRFFRLPLVKNMENHLKTQLEVALKPDYCEVVNESSQHSGPATESHFKLVVVSEQFNEMKLRLFNGEF